MSTTPRIYVACLASYNAGTHHGAWIDCDQDVSAIWEAIHQILKTSPEPNVQKRDAECPDCHHIRHVTISSFNDTIPGECGECGSDCAWTSEPYPSAEEHAIHDHEGFGKYNPGEYGSIDTIAEVAELIEKHGEVFAALLEEEGGDLDRAKKTMREGYRGEYPKFEDFVAEMIEEQTEIPAAVANYIDWARMAKDWESEYTVIKASGSVYVFEND